MRQPIPLLTLPSPHHSVSHSLLNRNIERRTRRRHLDNGRPEQNRRLDQRPIRHRTGNERIRLPRHRIRNHGRDHVSLHRPHHARRVQAAAEGDIRFGRDRALHLEGEANPLRRRLALRGLQHREGLDRQRRVRRRTPGDERGREGVHLVKAEGGAVRVSGGDLAEVEALQRGVDGLGDENGAGNAEVFFRGDEGGAAEIGRGADAFEHGRQRHEGFGVRVGEAVGAGLDGLGAQRADGRFEGLHVQFFVVGDVFEVGVVEGAEASVEEHLFGHGREGLFVEDVFEVLELRVGVRWMGRFWGGEGVGTDCEGILEDVDVGDGLSLFNDGGGEGED